MQGLTPDDLEAARALLAQHLAPTRLVLASSLARTSGAQVYLKLESEGPTGSFKVRGALTAAHRRLARGPLAGLVACSTGNHGAAVAYVARQVGVPATVFLPERPNPVKRARIADLHATVVEVGRDYDAAREHAVRYARERGFHFVEDGWDSDLTLGPATIACEILAELPATDVIYVPVGGTTLIQGVAFATRHLKPGVRIVGVQAAGAPAYHRSWMENRVVTTETCDTIADGLAVRCPTAGNVQALRELVDEMRLCSEEELLRAIYRLLLDEHTLAEPAGAAATAAFLQTGRAHAGQTVVLLVTGANLTPELLRRAILAAPEMAG